MLLLAAAAAVLLTGLLGTLLVFRSIGTLPPRVSPAFWGRLSVAAILTLASLMLRGLRWIFLMRRAETRMPIRDAYIGYFAGLSLLLVPFLVGEMAVRAVVHRTRRGIPVGMTVAINVSERLCDLLALALMTGAAAILHAGHLGALPVLLVVLPCALFLKPVREACVGGALLVGRLAGRLAGERHAIAGARLAETKTWGVALVASVAAWVLPGLALWHVTGFWARPFGLAAAEHAYAASASLGGVVLAPGGVLVAGERLLATLQAAGFEASESALTVFGVRLATVGVATMLGIVFLLVHVRTRPEHTSVPQPAEGNPHHFDDLADAYEMQIPESRRQALLASKTQLMREFLDPSTYARGLDAGCGPGWYLARMRQVGYRMTGIDRSAGQLRHAARAAGRPGLVAVGSVDCLPVRDASYDFVYIINVLHHLPSVAAQRAVFAELARVLRPGGLLFVHEMNTRNILFRFYMGYVFPSINCIDEGVERWLRPDRMAAYTELPVEDLRFFTFFPEFLPETLVRWLKPLERLLEASPLRVYSAHYMAILRKP